MQKRTFFYVIITTVLLTIPLVSMQFFSDVSCTLFDFMAATILLATLFISFETIMFYTKNKRRKLLLSGFVVFVFLMIWVELAVGIFD